jgi:hypothetical protein
VLAELASELDELEREIRTLEGQLLRARRNPDTSANLRRLAAAAAARLDNPDLETQTAVIELLDIRVKATADGYEISGSIPLDMEAFDGKMPTREPRGQTSSHPLPSAAYVCGTRPSGITPSLPAW